MTSIIRFATLLILATSFAFVANAQVNSFSGRASAVRASVTAVGQPVITTSLTDTGYLPATGGGNTLAGADANLLNIVNVSSSNVSTSGVGDLSSASAIVDGLAISAGGISINASAVQSVAQAACPGGIASASSTISDLSLNGESIVISGAPNQYIPLTIGGATVGSLIINEQAPEYYMAEVNALHLRLTLLDNTKVDVVVGAARAGIGCSEAPPINIFDGQATGVWVYSKSELQGLTTALGDTGRLGSTGGDTTTSVQGGSLLGGLLTTGAITSTSSGGAIAGTPETTTSSSDVGSFGVNVAGIISIAASTLSSSTHCQCSTKLVASCSAASQVGSLSISIPLLPTINVPITGEPNQLVTLPLGLGSIYLNESHTNMIGVRGIAKSTAMRLMLNVAGLSEDHIVVADSTSTIMCRRTAPPATVTFSGRIVSETQQPLSNIRVVLVGGNQRLTAMSNGFGYFTIPNVPTGVSYTLGAKGRTYYFPAQGYTINDPLSNIVVVGLDLGLRQAPVAPVIRLAEKR